MRSFFRLPGEIETDLNFSQSFSSRAKMLLYVLRPSGDDGDVLLIKRQKIPLLIRKLRTNRLRELFRRSPFRIPLESGWALIKRKRQNQIKQTRIFSFFWKAMGKKRCRRCIISTTGGLGG